MSLSDLYELSRGFVPKAKLPRGVRHRVHQLASSEDDIDKIVDEERRLKMRVWMAAWRAKNREKLRAKAAEYRRKNRARVKLMAKRWRERNMDKYRLMHRAAALRKYWKNPEKMREYRRHYRATKPELVRASKRRAYLRHHEKNLAYRRAYYAKNRDSINAKRREARRNENEHR